MEKKFLLALCLLVFLSSPYAMAYPSAAAKETILELLNGKAQKGMIVGKNPVSFDDINCSRGLKICTVSMRYMISQDDFFTVRKELCNIEPVDTVYDILDDKTGDLTEYFLKKVTDCL